MNYLEEAEELREYIERYSNPEDLKFQWEHLQHFWETYCVKRVYIFGIKCFKVHNENAKNMWAELDALLWSKNSEVKRIWKF